MINAYKNFFKGYVDFAGRSTRSDYWWIWLGNMILYIPFFFAYGNAISNPQDEGALIGLGGTAIIYMVIGLALLLPSLALMVRRFETLVSTGHLSLFYSFHWVALFFLYFWLCRQRKKQLLQSVRLKKFELKKLSKLHLLKRQTINKGN